MRNRIIRLFLLAAALICLLAAAAGTAESMHREIENPAFDMEVSVGYDGRMTYGKVMPVRVRIRNFGEDFEGVLGVNAYVNAREYDRYEKEVALPAGSEREYVLPVIVYARQQTFTAEMIRDGEILCAANADPETLINPSAMLIGVLSTRPQSLNNLNIDRESDVLARYEFWQTIPLTTDTFPEELSLLKSFGMLVLDDVDPASLSAKQQGLLTQWLRSGRVLLCGGGPNGTRNISFFSEYTGLKTEGMTTSGGVTEALEHLIGRSGNKKTLQTAIAEYSGAEPLIRDEEGHGLIWRTETGGGRIYTTAFDIGDARLNSENLMHYFWQQLLVDQDQDIYSGMMYTSTDDYSGHSVNASYAVPIMVKSHLAAGMLIICGMLVLGWVLWLILKKKDRSKWMWPVLPVLAVLTAGGLLLLSSGSDTSRPMAAVTNNLVQDGTGVIRDYGWIAAAVPSFGRHSYSVNGEMLRKPEYDYVDYDDEEDAKNTEPDRLRTCYTSGGENTVTAESLEPWTQINLTAERDADITGRITGEVWMEEDGLHGEIVNGTDLRLSAGFLVNGGGYVSVPALEPGGKAEIRMTRKTFDDPLKPKYEDGGLYPGNAGLYTVIISALGINENGNLGEELQEKDLYATMISGATDALRQSRGAQYFSAADSSIFAYCAKPEQIPEIGLKVDGKPVTNIREVAVLTADISFVPVGRTGVVFRGAGTDIPVRVETDENRMPTETPVQNGKNIWYHPLNENPTFLFRLEGLEGVRTDKLQIMEESYYANQATAYALNARTREWEEIPLNSDITDPGRYLDEQGRLFVQMRNNGADMYADISTPLINLEGRLADADH